MLSATRVLQNQIIRGISRNKHATVVLMNNTAAVQRAIDIHQVVGQDAVLLGRTMSASLLLQSLLKSDRVLVEMRGDESAAAEIQAIQAEASGSSHAHVFGYLVKNNAPAPTRHLRSRFGEHGALRVLQIPPSSSKPYSSMVQLQRGDVLSDLQGYFRASDQSSATFVDLPVELRADGRTVAHSGGVLVRPLPFAPAPITEALTRAAAEESVEIVDAIPGILIQNLDLKRVAEEGPALLDSSNSGFVARSLRWHCRCSREKMVEVLRGNPDVVRNILLGAGGQPQPQVVSEGSGEAVSLECPSCRTSYGFSYKELQQLQQLS